jgi:hypothetical protein
LQKEKRRKLAKENDRKLQWKRVKLAVRKNNMTIRRGGIKEYISQVVQS